MRERSGRDVKELSLKQVTCTNASGSLPQAFRIEFRVDANDTREPYSAADLFEAVGETSSIERKYAIDDDFGFGLLDDAKPDGNRMDTAVVTDSAPSTGTVTLQGNGITCEIGYELTGFSGDKLERTVTYFENSTLSGVWPNLASKSTLTDRIRVLTNTQQDQSGTGAFAFDQDGSYLCAPSGIGFALAHFEPRRFVEACRSIYEAGEMLTRTGRIRANPTLRRRRVKKSELEANIVESRGPIHPLDWMVAATLANIRDPDSTSSSASAAQMLDWTEEVIGYENTRMLATGQGHLDMLEDARDVLDNGGVVFFGVPLTALEGITWWQDWFDPPMQDHIITLVEVQSLPSSPSGDARFVVQQQGRRQSFSGPVDALDDVVYSAMAGKP